MRISSSNFRFESVGVYPELDSGLRFDTQFSTELHYFEEVLMLVGCRFRLVNYTEFELKRQCTEADRNIYTLNQSTG